MDRIIVRTLCEDVFSAFLTQFLHFQHPYHLVIIKYHKSSFTPYQRYLLDLLRSMRWTIETINTKLTGDSTCYEVYSYLVRNKLTEFFWVDDDMLFSESVLDILKFYSSPKSMVSPIAFFPQFRGYHVFFSHVPDPAPIYFRLSKVPKIPDSKILLTEEGRVFGWVYFVILLSRFVDKVLLLLDSQSPLSLHVSHTRSKPNFTPWKQRWWTIDDKVKEVLTKFAPDFPNKIEIRVLRNGVLKRD